MSAFMVADETINRVITWLSWEITKSQWLKKKVEDALQIDTSKHNWEEDLGHAMFDSTFAVTKQHQTHYLYCVGNALRID